MRATVQFLDWPDAGAAVAKVDPQLIEPDALTTHYEVARLLLDDAY